MSTQSVARHVAIFVMATLAFSSVALAVRANVSAVPFLSVSVDDIVGYVSRCHSVPTEEEMRREIPALLASFAPSVELKNEVLQETGTTATLLRYLDLEKTPELVNMNFDGLQLRQIDVPNIVLLHALTSPVDAHTDHLHYPTVVQRANVTKKLSTLSVARTCLTDACRKSGLIRFFDLTKYNQTSVCHTALCAAERIFGPERAVLMAWTYLKYGVSLTPFANTEADRYGFSADTIRSIIIALRSTPSSLRKAGFKRFSFYRAERDDTYRSVFGQRVIATNAGAVYNAVDEKNEVEQVGIFIHETGHRVAGDFNEKDGSPEWQTASGWRMIARGDQRYYGQDPWVSKYQQYDAFEDFAETYALYRLNPKRLQTLSPSRFNYMKTEIFGGVDYLSNTCDGSR